MLSASSLCNKIEKKKKVCENWMKKSTQTTPMRQPNSQGSETTKEKGTKKEKLKMLKGSVSDRFTCNYLARWFHHFGKWCKLNDSATTYQINDNLIYWTETTDFRLRSLYHPLTYVCVSVWIFNRVSLTKTNPNNLGNGKVHACRTII